MECPECGSRLRDDAHFCMGCGTMVAAPVKVTAPVMRPVGWEVEDLNGAISRWTPQTYLGSASRIPRFIAWIIDNVILASAFLGLLVVTGQQRVLHARPDDWEDIPYVAPSGWVLAIMTLTHASYFIIFAASGWQGTPGKRLLSLRVTDCNGERLGLIQSIWRYLCQAFVLGVFIPIAMLISSIFGFFGPFPVLLALVLVLAANQRQSPWDMLAGTRVLE